MKAMTIRDGRGPEQRAVSLQCTAYQNRIISGFCADGVKSREILAEEGVSCSEIAARNRKSIATLRLRRTPPLNRNAAFLGLVSEIASDVWGPLWAVVGATQEGYNGLEIFRIFRDF